MTMFTKLTGLAFELPPVIYFMANVGIMGPEFMRTYRRHAIIVITIIAVFITPPDLIAMTVVTLPLLALYEASIFIAVRYYSNESNTSA